MTFADGAVYEGEFRNDFEHGQGTRRNADGTVFHAGEWLSGRPAAHLQDEDDSGHPPDGGRDKVNGDDASGTSRPDAEL